MLDCKCVIYFSLALFNDARCVGILSENKKNQAITEQYKNICNDYHENGHMRTL